jgi:glutaredoxin-like protein NrdH
MLEKLKYTTVDGERRDRDITVYALSTCGFCKRALTFLGAKGIAYRYVHVDLIPLEVKNEVKKELKEKFQDEVAFPFAVIDGKEHLVGFVEPDWIATLGLDKEGSRGLE